MKAYTDIEQSKKLAKILPIESADMCYNDGELRIGYAQLAIERDDYFPCWSLAALLEVIPHEIKIWDLIYDIKIYPKNNNWFISYKNINEEFVGTYSTFLIDACVEMIIKLNELKLLCL